MIVRTVCFKIHWFLGITFGLVLALQGVTGASLAYEDDLIVAFGPSNRVPSVDAQPLSPDHMLAIATAGVAPEKVARVLVWSAPTRPNLVMARAADGAHLFFVDKYSGRNLGPADRIGLFQLLEKIHRFLGLPASPGKGLSVIGRQCTRLASFALIVFAVSGLYLRWPRNPWRWRPWVFVNWISRGRSLYRSLHVVFATFLIPLYLISAVTGIMLASGPHHDAFDQIFGTGGHRSFSHPSRHGQRSSRLAGASPDRTDAAVADPFHAFAEVPPMDAAWRTFLERAGPNFGAVAIGAAPRGQGLLEVAHFVRGGFRTGVADRYTFAPESGALLSTDLVGQRAMADEVSGEGTFSLHSGGFWGRPGVLVMALSSLVMPFFYISGWMMYLARRRQRQQAKLKATGR